MTFPFNPAQIDKQYESIQFTYPVDFNLPDSVIKIANNMLQIVELRSVFVLRLDEDGNFVRSENIEHLKPSQRFEYLEKARKLGWPIKIECMETYNYEIRKMCHILEDIAKQPINCHLFWGQAGFGSFDWHEDDGHVWAYLESGKKIMQTASDYHTMNAGDWVFMPEGILHKASNETENVLLSFGSYDFWHKSLILG